MSWSQFNAGRNSMQVHTPGTCHWLQFNPPPVGLHPAAQVRHVHLVKKRRPPQQQQLVPPATRHDTTGGACHTTPACKQWGCPAVVFCEADVGKVMMAFILATDYDFIAYMSKMAFLGGSFFHAKGVFGI